MSTFTTTRAWRILVCDCDWWDHDTELGSVCDRCRTPILWTRVVPQPQPSRGVIHRLIDIPTERR